MIKIILSTMLVLISISSISQQTIPEGKLTQESYIEKSKKQKKVGFIFLAAGTSLIITAAVIPRGDLVDDGTCVGPYCSDKYQNDGIKSAFLIAGGVVALASIPIFIVSGKNRRKAKSVSFKLENTIQPRAQELICTSFPALRLKFNF